MTKADIVSQIAKSTGVEKVQVASVVDAFMKSVKDTMISGENIYLRGSGTFLIKKRAEKTARNILKNTTMIVSSHNIPAFKPAKEFATVVRKKK